MTSFQRLQVIEMTYYRGTRQQIIDAYIGALGFLFLAVVLVGCAAKKTKSVQLKPAPQEPVDLSKVFYMRDTK